MSLCECGCGRDAGVWTKTNTQLGWRKGAPRRFIHGHNTPVQDTTERFWKHVVKSAGDGCWLWIGGTNDRGYGRFHVTETDRKQLIYAHRFSFELHRGAIPEGLQVLHECDTPACVNPQHLFAGTRSDNMQDMVSKGRYVGRLKLTDDIVNAIRTAEGSHRSVARRFGISESHVRSIRAGRRRVIAHRAALANELRGIA